MNNRIFIIAGILLAIYIFISVSNRNRSRRRKSKKFMEGNTRKERTEKDGRR